MNAQSIDYSMIWDPPLEITSWRIWGKTWSEVTTFFQKISNTRKSILNLHDIPEDIFDQLSKDTNSQLDLNSNQEDHLDFQDKEEPSTSEYQPRTTRNGRVYFSACLQLPVRTVQPDSTTCTVPVTCVPHPKLNVSHKPVTILQDKV